MVSPWIRHAGVGSAGAGLFMVCFCSVTGCVHHVVVLVLFFCRCAVACRRCLPFALHARYVADCCFYTFLPAGLPPAATGGAVRLLVRWVP